MKTFLSFILAFFMFGNAHASPPTNLQTLATRAQQQFSAALKEAQQRYHRFAISRGWEQKPVQYSHFSMQMPEQLGISKEAKGEKACVDRALEHLKNVPLVADPTGNPTGIHSFDCEIKTVEKWSSVYCSDLRGDLNFDAKANTVTIRHFKKAFTENDRVLFRDLQRQGVSAVELKNWREALGSDLRYTLSFKPGDKTATVKLDVRYVSFFGPDTDWKIYDSCLVTTEIDVNSTRITPGQILKK